MSTNSLYLGATNGVCVNSIIKDKIREYMMGDSSPPMKSSIDVTTSEVNKENTSVIHENKKSSGNKQDPVSTTDLGLPSSLNVSMHNTSEPCPHRQDLVTASIRRIGNSLDALLHESKNASQVKAVKKTSPLTSQQNTDRMFISSDQIRYRKSVTLHDICEEYIQFITVNSSVSPDEEAVTTTSESDSDKQLASKVEPELQIIPMLPVSLVPSEKRRAQISVITINENLPRNVQIVKQKSVEEVPVATDECEKSNGGSDSSTDKLPTDARGDSDDNSFPSLNGVKSGTVSVDAEISVNANRENRDVEEHENNVNEEAAGVEIATKVPSVSLSNGISHDVNDALDEDVEEAEADNVEKLPEPCVSETTKDEVAMEIDGSPLEDPPTNEIEAKSATKSESEPVLERVLETPVEPNDVASEVPRTSPSPTRIEMTNDAKPSDDVTVMETESNGIEELTTEEEPTNKEELTNKEEPTNEKERTLITSTEEKPEEKVSAESKTDSTPVTIESDVTGEQSDTETTTDTKFSEDVPKASADTPIVTKSVGVPMAELEDAKVNEKVDSESLLEAKPSVKVELIVKEEPALAVTACTENSNVATAAAVASSSSTISITNTTSSTSTVNSIAVAATAAVVGVKRKADATDELEPERDGGISSSSSASGSGSETENAQDCKRIRFDESIFEEDERERLIREFVDRSTEGAEEIGKNCDKLQHEIAALSDLARAKELEWNSIMRLLKLKEEMLERILFKKRHLDCQNKPDSDPSFSKAYKSWVTTVTSSTSSEQSKVCRSETNTPTSISSHVTVVPITSSTMSTNSSVLNALSHDFFKSANASITAVDATNKLRPHRPILPKPPTGASMTPAAATVTAVATTSIQPQPASHQVSLQAHAGQPMTQAMLQSAAAAAANSLLVDQNSVIGEGRQGPIVDVKSIIADFRSKNPDSLPRRGRRNLQFTNRGPDGASGPRFIHNTALLSMANMALGSGSHVRTNVSSTTHSDHRPGSFFIGQDGSIPTALGRPDLQIRHANIDSLMLSVNPAASGNSSQLMNSTNNGSSSSVIGNSGNSSCGVSIAPASITNSSSSNSSSQSAASSSFQEALVKFAKMNEKRDISSTAAPAAMHNMTPNKSSSHLTPPPPYPEVTLHPVSANQFSGSPPVQNSLLHGILTKSTSGVAREHHPSSSMSTVTGGMGSVSANNIQHRPTTFSPTLARLLTAPERNRTNRSNVGSSNRNTKSALSEILNSKKTRTEVTITPVTTSTSCSTKNGADVVMVQDDDDESEVTDRLVIDEGRDTVADPTSNVIPADQVPECQGCHKKAAQFVCAGCGNQWYCSRDCQVQAWEDHSEMCSG